MKASYAPARLGILCGACVILLLSCAAHGQPFYGVVHRPPGVKYDQLSTQHFQIIFQRGLDTLAVQVGRIAERSYPEVVEQAGLEKPLRLPIVLNAYNDASNGFVTPFPYRMEIDASPIKGKILNPRHEDWIAQVVPHELAHAAQAEIRGGFGVGMFVRLLSPDWSRALNLGIPRGFTEGFAVSHESRGPNAIGRLNYSFARMQTRAAASENPWTLSQVLDPPGYTRPFDRFYTGGGILYDYLSDSTDTEILIRTSRFYNRWPFLGFGVALWHAAGRPPWVLSDQFERYSRQTVGDVTTEGDGPSQITVLTKEPGLACRRPTWVDNDTIVSFCSGYQVDPGFYLIDATTGIRSLLSRQAVTEDYFLSVDAERKELLFAQYRPLGIGTGAFRSHLKQLDLVSSRTIDMENSDRLYAPIRMSDGSIVALNDVDQSNELVKLTTDGVSRVLFGERGTRILEVREIPTGGLVALVNRSGEQSLYTATLDADGVGPLEPVLAATRGSLYDPNPSPDGKRIVFTADPDGVPNVYALDASSGSIVRLTDASFGAFEPSVSPDGQRLAFVNHVHQENQIAILTMGVEERRADSLFIADSKPRAATALAGVDPASRPYRPFPSFLRPRAVVPFYRFSESRVGSADRRLGPGLGVSVFGTDVMQQWAYSATGFIQENRPWGQVVLQTGNHVVRPYILFSDRPKSGITRIEGELARVPYEERSIEVGGFLPVRFSANAENTSLSAGMSAEYRSLRLLDGDGKAITEFDDRITLNPLAMLSYRLRANLRDIIPASGLRLTSRAELDVRTEPHVVPARSWRSDASIYLPVVGSSSTGVRLLLGTLWQNRGSVFNTDTFLARGYDPDKILLADGTFLKVGIEAVQPIAWIDRGIVLIPISLQALYLYGFAESVGRSGDWLDPRSSAGAGVGFRLLIAHHIGFDMRLGVARLLEDNEWAATFR